MVYLKNEDPIKKKRTSAKVKGTEFSKNSHYFYPFLAPYTTPSIHAPKFLHKNMYHMPFHFPSNPFFVEPSPGFDTVFSSGTHLLNHFVGQDVQHFRNIHIIAFIRKPSIQPAGTWQKPNKVCIRQGFFGQMGHT